MAEFAALGWAPYLFCGLAVFVGTLLQRLAGQGFGMVAAPLIALVAPQFVPASLLILGAAVGLGATAVERSAVTLRELPPGFAGRTLGAVVAVWIALRMDDAQGLSLAVAGVVYLGIGLSLLGVRVAIAPVSLLLAGLVSGVMGTLTAVGAPPMALLYQHEPSRRAGAMQNVFFLWGMVVSILALALAGLIGLPHLGFAVALLPFTLLALVLAQPLAVRVARARIRPFALALAGLAATVLLVKTLALMG